ncbi:tetrameric acyl-CoA thioesterase [Sesbania bispinosa]|nr:tetrameric acyl-CoA thioesterase [Sesbania bispinosa]
MGVRAQNGGKEKVTEHLSGGGHDADGEAATKEMAQLGLTHKRPRRGSDLLHFSAVTTLRDEENKKS